MENIVLTEQDIKYWEQVFNAEFIFEKGCYNTCSSFCCRWDSPDLPLRVIPKGGTLFYLPKEYEFIKRYGKVTDILPYKMKANIFNNQLQLYYKHCNDDSNCNIKFSRSLYCKLYPFLPVFNIDGELLDLKYISVYDVTFNLIGQKTPCYVIDLKDKYINIWNQSDSNIHLLKEPYVLFYLMAGNLLHDNYVKTISANNELMQLKGKDFWKKWEKLYLAGKFVDKIQLEKDLENLYTQMQHKYNLNIWG